MSTELPLGPDGRCEGGVRLWGDQPRSVAVIHGGPGAPGYMAPVARELAAGFGVVEPLQSAMSLEGQIAELHAQLTEHATLPVKLVASSWGAILALFVAARFPELVARMVLVGCAVFDAASSASIGPRRMARLTPRQRERIELLQQVLASASGEEGDQLMAEWGSLLSEADMYDPLPSEVDTTGVIKVQAGLHRRVWADFVALRDTSGALAARFSGIRTPTLVVHGDYDPHPIDGIRPYLERWLADVRFRILRNCGHYPWRERQAREAFFHLVHNELLSH